MSRSDLQCSGAKGYINRSVSDDGDFLAYDGEDDSVSYQILVAFVFRIHSNCRVAEEGFRSGSSYNDEALIFS